MKTAEEHLLAWINRKNNTNYTSITRKDVDTLSTNSIINCMESFGRIVQEAQIELCANDFAKGTIAEGGEDELIKDVKRVIE